MSSSGDCTRSLPELSPAPAAPPATASEQPDPYFCCSASRDGDNTSNMSGVDAARLSRDGRHGLAAVVGACPTRSQGLPAQKWGVGISRVSDVSFCGWAPCGGRSLS